MTSEATPELAYATKPIPWLHKGTDVSSAPTAAEAIKLAGLDWTVAVGSVYDDRGREIPGWQRVYRTDNGQTLGIPGARYQPIQNADSFDHLDKLVEDRVLRYAGTGSFDDGVTVWMQAYLDEDIRILDDEYKRFLVAKTMHDGKGAHSTHAGFIRIVCANTLAAATSSQALIRVHHVGDVLDKLAKARLTLAAVTEQHARFEKWLTTLGSVQTTPSDVQTVSETMFGPLDDATPTRRRNAIEAFLDIYNAERERQGSNGYTLAQAVTGFADHGVSTKAGIDRLSSVLNGQINVVKTKGLAVVSEVTGVRL